MPGIHTRHDNGQTPAQGPGPLSHPIPWPIFWPIPGGCMTGRQPTRICPTAFTHSDPTPRGGSYPRRRPRPHSMPRTTCQGSAQTPCVLRYRVRSALRRLQSRHIRTCVMPHTTTHLPCDHANPYGCPLANSMRKCAESLGKSVRPELGLRLNRRIFPSNYAHLRVTPTVPATSRLPPGDGAQVSMDIRAPTRDTRTHAHAS
jgi:hypothetical protein